MHISNQWPYEQEVCPGIKIVIDGSGRYIKLGPALCNLSLLQPLKRGDQDSSIWGGKHEWAIPTLFFWSEFYLYYDRIGRCPIKAHDSAMLSLHEIIKDLESVAKLPEGTYTFTLLSAKERTRLEVLKTLTLGPLGG